MSSEEVLYFGTFGPRAAGKTVALAVWALCGGDPDETISLEVASDFTVEYLRVPRKHLSEGKYPSFTPPEDPKPLEFIAYVTDHKNRKRRVRLRCIDFAGELTDPVWKAGPAEFKAAVAAWFRQCNIIFLFIDSTSTDRDVQDAIDRLLSELDQQPTRHGGTRRVIYLMMTKADRLPGVQRDNITSEAVVTESLKTHPVYQRVQRQLARRTDTALWQVHLTSAVGWDFDRIQDPAQRRVEPANLFEPLRDAVFAADEIKRTGHETLWQNLQAGWGGPPGLFTPCAKRLRELDDFAAAHHVQEGSIRSEIARCRDELVQMGRIQLVTRVLVALVLFLTVSGFVWFQGRRNQSVVYEQYARLQLDKPADASARERVAFFTENLAPRQWEWLWGLSDRQRQANEIHAKDLAIVARLDAEEAWATLKQQDADLSRKNQNPRRHQNALAYAGKYQQAAPEAIRTDLEALLKETRTAYDEDRAARQQAEKIALVTLDDFPRKAQALREYAKRPDALEPEQATNDANRMVVDEQKYRDEDRQAWDAAVNLPSSNEFENAARATAVRAYLDRQYCVNRAEAQSLLADILKRGFDMEEYNQIVQASQNARTGDDIERVTTLIRTYLDSTRHQQLMGTTVRAFAARVEEFKQPRNVDVYLQSVALPKDFVTGTLTGYPVPYVEVSLNGSTHSWRGTQTPLSGAAYSAFPRVRLGSFTVRHGSYQSLSVFTKVKRELWPEEKASGSYSDGSWVGHLLNGTVYATSGGHQIPVVLSCPDLVFPTLNESFPAR